MANPLNYLILTCLASTLVVNHEGQCQQFGPAEDVSNSSPGGSGVSLADMDGDGDLDVIASAQYNDTVSWFENSPGSTWHQTVISNVADGAYSVDAADLDGDGDVDVLAALGYAGVVTWYENQGNGASFSASILNNLAGSRPTSVQAADLDGDGKLDVLSSSRSNDTISWCQNLGSGQFGQPIVVSAQVPDAEQALAIDADGDGDLDILSASPGNGFIGFHENLGNGLYAPHVQLISAPNLYTFDVGDVDLDGDFDIAYTTAPFISSGALVWAENIGALTFTPFNLDGFTAGSARSPIILDLNGDALPDIAVCGDDTVKWYRQIPGSSFSAGETLSGNYLQPFSLAAGDIDSNGLPDLVVTSFDNGLVAWHENLLEPDRDQDGLSDAGESVAGTSIFDQDSDDDGLSDGEEVNALRADSRWQQGPSGDFYRLALADTWSGASAAARSQGYELASIQNVTEATWLADTFGDVGDGFWIGYSDFLGAYEWSDGSPLGYERWAMNEPSATPAGVYVGGPSSSEPGYWYADLFGATPRLAVWEAPGPISPMTSLDPLSFDTDGDGIGDGMEDGRDAIVWDGSGLPSVTGTDPLVFAPDADPATTTDPLNLDTDNDGIADGDEDQDKDGARTGSETDAADPDTDNDDLPDGLELGLTAGSVDTDGAVFVPDTDPGSLTDPLLTDTDAGGVPDGIEDQDKDGAVDTFETDPGFAADEALAFYVSNFAPGQQLRFEVYQAGPSSVLAPVASLAGPGPTALGIGVIVDLTPPLFTLTPTLADSQGHRAWNGPLVPGNLALGTSVWFQLVEIPFGPGAERVSNPILLPVGDN